MTIALAEPILTALGFGSVATIETNDPDSLGAALALIEAHVPTPRPASFLSVGPKREVAQLALRELHSAAPTPIDVVALPDGAPFGSVEIDVAGCTLCLSCVAACPTGALRDDPERPMLRFAEDACVQCGLCKATCPEKVISLRPQLDFRAATAVTRVLKEEEPFHCTRCGKLFRIQDSETSSVMAWLSTSSGLQAGDQRAHGSSACTGVKLYGQSRGHGIREAFNTKHVISIASAGGITKC